MSMLIDSINDDNQTLIRGKWYISKPYGIMFICSRIKDACRVLFGKSIAVHYKEDENGS